jgi:hypothetical protein
MTCACLVAGPQILRKQRSSVACESPSARAVLDSSVYRAESKRPRAVVAQAIFSSFSAGQPRVPLEGLRDNRLTRATYDVVGLGEAMVDYSGMVSTEYLANKNVACGGRRYEGHHCEC